MAEPVSFRILSIDLFERPVRLRLPFRFGVVTLTETPQAFVRARIELADGRSAAGAAAELMVPKWFDKNPALSNEDNVAQLRSSLRIARGLYLDGTGRSGFGHFAAHHEEQVEAAAGAGLNALVAAFGPALIDRALLDALGRAIGAGFYVVMGRNVAGLDVRSGLTPDLSGFDMDAFLGSLRPAEQIDVRHTVGLLDPLTSADLGDAPRPADTLPVTLQEIVATYGHRWFKLKVGGDLEADLDRLTRIAAVLDAEAGSYRATLDGNEQYGSAEEALRLWHALRERPALRQLAASIAYIEQPIARAATLAAPITMLAAERPVIIDESDAPLDAFVQAAALGYEGISSKACKGVYRSFVNAARAAKWNAEAGRQRYFLSGEDLTTQAGLAVQQDLALVNLLGLKHVERNGHHYVDGFAGAAPAEGAAFLAAHPDLYSNRNGRANLDIQNGRLSIASLNVPGLASAVHPDFDAMTPFDPS